MTDPRESDVGPGDHQSVGRHHFHDLLAGRDRHWWVEVVRPDFPVIVWMILPALVF